MILGHQKQRQFLRYLVKTNKIAHAYLFSGESQIGKKTIALEFIKLLNCEITDFNKKPCQTCRSCQAVQKNQHPDLIIVKPELSSFGDTQVKEKQEIKIAQIRNIQQKLSFSPYSASIKAVILDKAERLNQEAASAFLKILEEPKGKTIFILISSHPEMILPTILSRVQRIKFFPIALTELKAYLEQKQITENQIKEIISFSLARPGIAIDYLNNPDKLKDEKEKIQQLEKLICSNLFERFEYAKKFQGEKMVLGKDSQDLKKTLNIWLKYLRNILLSKISSENSRVIEVRKILKAMQKTIFLLSYTNIKPQLALETLMLEL